MAGMTREKGRPHEGHRGVGATSGWFQRGEIRDDVSQDHNPSRKCFTVSETRSQEFGEMGET